MVQIENVVNMSNKTDRIDESTIPETDFSAAVRGKYYERAVAGTNVVLLEPDVAKVFHDSAIVSQALREYLQEHGGPPSSAKRAG
jgi:hypothetical protein